jgi:hypothetical protein
MKTLNELGLERGTDKASNAHNYLSRYEPFLAPYRNKNIKLLEIGIDKGNSLKMWADYFYNAELILGSDIEDRSYLQTDKIKTVISDQSSPHDLDLLGAKYGPFDIIGDDGSHNADHQLLSFSILFPFVKPNGLYIIEDTLCSYDKERWGAKGDIHDLFRRFVGDVNLNGQISNYEINSDKYVQVFKYMDNLTYCEKHIEMFTVGMGFCIIKKM